MERWQVDGNKGWWVGRVRGSQRSHGADLSMEVNFKFNLRLQITVHRHKNKQPIKQVALRWPTVAYSDSHER